LAEAAGDWPRAREDLKQAVGISQSLAEAVGKDAPKERRQNLLLKLSGATGKVWARYFGAGVVGG